MKSVTNYLDPDYNQVGNTRLYLRKSYNFDFWGQFDEYFYGSTYSNGGYHTALSVNDNYPETIDAANLTEIYGIEVNTFFEPQGEMVKVSYVLKNTTQENVTISLGTYADVQIGDNDCAPISRRIDNYDSTYGLTMKDGSGAELCILFGAGLAGVTPVSDFWFGNYGGNAEPHNIVGEYYDTGNFMYENGNYDSAMGWCWKDQTISPDDSATYSFLIGIGEVNLQPGISYAVTPDNPDEWNDIYAIHRINIEGLYSSPAGVDGRIEYAVEYPEMWQALTETIPSGTEFSNFIEAYFDPYRKIHTIYLRIVDNVGNTTMLDPIEYLDVNHVEYEPFVDFTYDGNEHFQNISSSEIGDDEYIVANYENNINAGTAYFTIDGVYPTTIGRKYCEFQINPAPLEGTITLLQTEFDFDPWSYCQPEYTLEGPVANLTEQSYWDAGDFYVRYTDNHYAGTALMTIEGINNYSGTISASFTINKINCPEEWIYYSIPEEDITYDGEAHEAWVSEIDGIGQAIITYKCNENVSTEAPVNEGDYEVYLEYPEGPGIYAVAQRHLGNFSIYELDENDWKCLRALNEELSKTNDISDFWNLTENKTSAAHIYQFNIEKGAITKLHLGSMGLKGDLPLSAFRFNNVNTVDLSYNELTGDIDRLAVLKEENPEAVNSLQTLYLGVNNLTGNAGVLAQFPNIKVAHIGFNSISEVVPMLNPDIEFPYDNQTLNLTLNLDLRDFDLDTLAKQLPTIVLYNHYAQSYTPENLGVYIYDNTGWNLSIDNLNGEYFPYSNNDMRYEGKCGDILEAMLPNDCHAKVQLWFNQGDVNFTASVDILDLQSVIDEILNRRFFYYYYIYTPFNFTAANLFEDEVINVQDAVCLVNMLLESDPVPSRLSHKVSSLKEETIEASVFTDGDALFISSEKEVAAFDLTVNSTDLSLVTLPGMTVTKKTLNGKTRIIGYSLSGTLIPAGTFKIADISNDAIVSYAMLSDTNAMEIHAALNDKPSGVATVEADQVVTINPTGIYMTLPDGTEAIWQILSSDGITLAKGTDVANGGEIHIPFNAQPGNVYILSVNYNGKYIYKKFNQK